MNARTERLERCMAYLAADPLNLHLLCEAADLQLQLGKRDEARELIAKALQQAPTHAPALSIKGLIEISSGDAAAAAATFAAIVVQGVRATGVIYNLAYALLLQQRYEEAEPWAREAAEHVDELPAAATLYVRTLHYLGKVQEAIDFANGTLELIPDQAELRGMLSTLYLDAGDLKAAEAAANAAVAARPDDSDALAVLGTLALAEQDAAKAQDFFDHAIRTRPDSGRAWAGKGLADMLRLDLGAAEKDLQSAVHNMPTHIGTWHALAWTQILAKKPKEAQASLQSALELNRNFGETHGVLAIVALMRGDVKAAQDSMKRAIGLDPNSFSGRFAQSLLLQVQSQPQKAQALLETILAQPILPDGSTIQQAVAKMLAQGAGAKKDAPVEQYSR
jgi:tetratricopeptide (TPR) repeat protein